MRQHFKKKSTNNPVILITYHIWDQGMGMFDVQTTLFGISHIGVWNLWEI